MMRTASTGDSISRYSKLKASAEELGGRAPLIPRKTTFFRGGQNLAAP
jgi:hypothetical protein